MKRKYFTVIAGFFVSIAVNAQNNKSSQEFSYEKDANALLKTMTLDEKIGQLNLVSILSNTGPNSSKNVEKKIVNGTNGNIFSLLGSDKRMKAKLALKDSTRLKIPLLNGLDIIHGYKTIFPIPLGIASSWNPDLVQETAKVAALEASSAGYNWTFSPMLDISRDARWGRVMEGYGEDTYLTGLYGAAVVKGYQGNSLSDSHSLLACVKHFAFYGLAESGREYNSVEIGMPTAYNYYLPPYRAAIDAGAYSVMTSFNTINGVPATINKWLLTDVLRKEWKFNGFVVTDYNAINEVIAHGAAANSKGAALKSFNAGVDMDMMSESFVENLKILLAEKKITEKQIDEACRKILIAKFKLNLFKNPYRGLDDENASTSANILTDANKKIARESATKSIVLLKNDHQILPLKKDAKIALIGPFANNQLEMFSSWAFTGSSKDVVTMLDGIKRINPNVQYAQGTLATDNPLITERSGKAFSQEEQDKLVNEALNLAKNSDVIVTTLGELSYMSGESKSLTDISLPKIQKELLQKLKATGKPIVLLLVNGRPMTIEDIMPFTDAILETWRLGTEAGSAVADVLFGNYNPSGKLTMSFPRNVGQIPIYYNELNTGRPSIEDDKNTVDFKSNYKDAPNTPLFPFGFGLSYTQFSYGDIQLSCSEIKGENQKLTVSILITNTGKYAGEETVQLYIRDIVASIARPVKELKHFQKITLNPGETKTVSFQLTHEDLKYYDNSLKYSWDSGKFSVFVGGNSSETKNADFIWNK